MLPVYICDDDDKIREALCGEISRQIMIGDYDMQIVLSTGSPDELLEAVWKETKRGVYFLDVDLKQEDEGQDGFWLGREIRARDSRGFIIYITSYGDLAFKTFQYHLEALDYIVMDNMLKMIPAIRECLRVIVRRIQEEGRLLSPTACFTVKTGEVVRHIPLTDIICFETSSRTHRIILYTETERLDFIGKMSEIEEKVGETFIRAHRSFLLNKEKIQSVDFRKNEITMISGQTCLLSRSMKNRLMNILEK